MPMGGGPPGEPNPGRRKGRGQLVRLFESDAKLTGRGSTLCKVRRRLHAHRRRRSSWLETGHGSLSEAKGRSASLERRRASKVAAGRASEVAARGSTKLTHFEKRE